MAGGRLRRGNMVGEVELQHERASRYDRNVEADDGCGLGRPESGSSWPSPGRLIRTLSNNASAGATNGQAREDANGNNRPQHEQQQQQQQPQSPGIDPLSQVGKRVPAVSCHQPRKQGEIAC